MGGAGGGWNVGSGIGGMLGSILGGPVGGALVSGGLGLLSGAMAQGGAEAQNDLNYLMFHEQMDFEERMYKNRHTYEVADLKNAGLNPILSANTAGSVPGASYAPAVNTRAQSAEILANSAAKMAVIGEQLEKVKQERVNTNVARKVQDSAIKEAAANASSAEAKAKIEKQNAEFSTSLPGKIAYWIQKYNPLAVLASGAAALAK